MLVYVLAGFAAVGVVALSAVLFRKLGRGTDDGEPDGATAGHSGAMLSALFLLAFAIAIVVPWTTTDSARQNTYAESQAIVEAYWSTTGLPAPASTDVQSGLRDYTHFVVDKEWREMKKGRLSQDGWSRLEKLRVYVSALDLKDKDQQESQASVLEQIQGLSAARRQRAVDAEAGPPAGLLVMTVVTGLVVIIFPFMAGARPRGMTYVPLVAMAALLGIGIFLAFDIAHAFEGALAVGPDAFTNALQEVQRIPGGG